MINITEDILPDNFSHTHTFAIAGESNSGAEIDDAAFLKKWEANINNVAKSVNETIAVKNFKKTA